MSFMLGWIRRPRRQAEWADPMGQLGISVWTHQWLDRRLREIHENIIDIVTGYERTNYVAACRMLHAVLIKAAEPWGRGGRELRKEVTAWLRLYKLQVLEPFERFKAAGLIDEKCYVAEVELKEEGEERKEPVKAEYVECRLEGEMAEVVNARALETFIYGRMILYDSWSDKDVTPEKVFLIQSLVPPDRFGPTPQLDKTGEYIKGARSGRPAWETVEGGGEG